MNTIFWDLETSDLEFVGQILNYSFVVVDNDWNVVDELFGPIRISNTQLPSPMAILANRIDVLKHQEQTNNIKYTEKYALTNIQMFINKWAEKNKEPLQLIGYNSTNFDLPYLRTSMIRNGINPHFKNVVYCDLLHASRYLACFEKEFQGKVIKEKIDLSLSNLAKTFFDVTQTHESRDDVLNTIKLARFYEEVYHIDVRTFNFYQPASGQKIVKRIFLDYDNHCTTSSMCFLLDETDKYVLWIDDAELEKNIGRLNEEQTHNYLASEKAKENVRWFNKATSAFFIDKNYKSNGIDEENFRGAKFFLGHINLKNFFPEKTCDVEQFIYSMRFKDMNILFECCENEYIKPKFESHHAQMLLDRYHFNLIKPEALLENEKFMEYVVYRYGGRMKLYKFDSSTEYKKEWYHPTLNDLLKQIGQKAKENPENVKLMKSLLKYYMSTPIFRIAKVVGWIT
jgi:hypothetical protein